MSRGYGSMTSERFDARSTMTSGGERGLRRSVHSSATLGEGARDRTSTDPDDEPSTTVGDGRRTAAVGVERYRPSRMVARRLRCRAPSGLEFPVVVIGSIVIAPETVCSEPG